MYSVMLVIMSGAMYLDGDARSRISNMFLLPALMIKDLWLFEATQNICRGPLLFSGLEMMFTNIFGQNFIPVTQHVAS